MLFRSSAEYEYENPTTIVAKWTWLIGLLNEVGVKVAQHMVIYNDSKASL